MIQSRSRHAPPRAAALVEALRGLGYSASTALADIVDNSIAAGATRVDLGFEWKGAQSRITIEDNGSGMSDAELERAMRLGDRNPLDERSSGDLGRFGLGLKTASFSQCRRLTVASRRAENEPACLRWDLDALARSSDDGWHLLEGPDPESAERLSGWLPTQGTLVVWEVLDRVVTSGFSSQDFLDLVDRVERHLAMVFHRYLEGPHPRLAIAINNRPVSPWDPFLSGHHATWSSPVGWADTLTGRIEFEAHVLPHRDWLTQRQLEDAGGPDGWTSQQGFYVYRNKRLLVAGSWLGLGTGKSWTKEEAHRLARIRLDIPNSADADWKIDIRKSTARPPVHLRARLTHLAEDTRSRARRVFAHRGQVVRVGTGREPIAEAWRAEHFGGGIRYRIERSHPAVQLALEAAGPSRDLIETMLRVVEETIPAQRIWLDTTEGRETPRTGFAAEAATEVAQVLAVTYRNLVLRRGMSPASARDRLLHTEPFNAYPELVAALSDDIEQGG